jgi:hypothetical protein
MNGIWDEIVGCDTHTATYIRCLRVHSLVPVTVEPVTIVPYFTVPPTPRFVFVCNIHTKDHVTIIRSNIIHQDRLLRV